MQHWSGGCVLEHGAYGQAVGGLGVPRNQYCCIENKSVEIVEWPRHTLEGGSICGQILFTKICEYHHIVEIVSRISILG
jgi:hypothetical protein